MIPQALSDPELIEALELAAARARMAGAGELRRVADKIAGLALEAGGRLARLAGDRALEALRVKISRLEDAAFHFQTCSTCRREGDRACESGRWFAAYLRGEHDEEGRPPATGPLLGKIRNVTLHADGRLTADLTVNDAGREFIDRVKAAGGDPADGLGARGGSCD